MSNFAVKETESYQRKKETSWRDVDGEGVILDLTNGSYYSVNTVGLEIWKRLDGKNPLKSIITEISSLFQKDQKRVFSDTRKFLQNLAKNELIAAGKPQPAGRRTKTR